jgi:hypothetical protein
MNKNVKNKIIDVMIELLNISKKHNLPVFCVVYDIEATNDSIMNYISVISDRTDWDGKPLSETDIELNIKKNIETFEKSNGYNPNGNSRLTLTKVFTLNNITFDNVSDMVTGNNMKIFNDYKFCDNIRLNN